MNIILNDLVSGRRRSGYAAFDLWIDNAIRHKGERNGIFIGRLPIHSVPIDRATIKPGRGASLQSPHGKAEAGKCFGKTDRRFFTNTACGNLFGADMNKAA
ncbi:hypothetical protein D3C87_1534190 [compost metagenome]